MREHRKFKNNGHRKKINKIIINPLLTSLLFKNFKNNIFIFILILLNLINLTPTNALRRRSENEEIQITVYPAELTVQEGREASFDCRARATDNSIYPEVRWTRVGGRLPDGVYESGGRLVFSNSKLAHSGRYICLAMHKGRSVEAFAQLQVQSFGPQEFQTDNNPPSQPVTCSANERACGGNECVKMEYVCDGERDCRDGSDELNCPSKRHCEPNEFKCNNEKCVQKMWLCDGDDDCGDGSDELNCKQRKPGDLCQATEFSCKDGRQCVPSSFHCDGTNDCHDGSDEIGMGCSN
ncbi:unnamed protein product [Meloidogyne enterolobii]|uniref:Uncharacterized protein n=1 Tax=Meloidogyne enterolobii TaxID=390850 RepID=A0ACB1AEL1_MELEN